MQSNPILLITFICIVAGAIIFSLVMRAKRKAASGSGTITDKNINEMVNSTPDGTSSAGISFNNSSNVTHDYSITVRPDNGGTEFKWPVSSGFYEAATIGDRVVKRSGTSTPEIVGNVPLQPPAPPMA